MRFAPAVGATGDGRRGHETLRAGTRTAGVTDDPDLSARAARFVPAGPTAAVPPQTDEIVAELEGGHGDRDLCHCLECGRQVVALEHPGQCLLCGSEAVMVEST